MNNSILTARLFLISGLLAMFVFAIPLTAFAHCDTPGRTSS